MSIVRCLVLAALATAAAAVETNPPLPPLPRSAPAVPAAGDSGGLPDDRLERRLNEAVANREARIAELLRARQGLRPATLGTVRPGLEAPAAARDAAWGELSDAIAEWIGRSRSGNRDPLATNRPTQAAVQSQALSATNLVAIAECWQEVAAAGTGDGDVREGLKALAAIDPAQMPDHLRPRLDWLAVWFQAELARRSADPAERSDAAGRARLAASDFRQRHPANELADMVEALLTGLADPGAVQSTP